MGREIGMKRLKGKIGKIRVDSHAKDGLKQGDLVEILDHWKEELFESKTSWEKEQRLRLGL